MITSDALTNQEKNSFLETKFPPPFLGTPVIESYSGVLISEARYYYAVLLLSCHIEYLVVIIDYGRCNIFCSWV